MTRVDKFEEIFGLRKETKMEQEIRIDGDKCYVLIPIHGEYYQKQVVMTKEVFIECYNRWIKGQTKEKSNE